VLGAEVIKIERPEKGDDIRYWGPPFWGNSSTMFHTYNREKRSLAVDLKDTAQVDRLRQFITDGVDVVLQNLRAGVAEKAGLGAERLTSECPRLIYCNIHAFGVSGPMRDQPGYDPLMQAFSGLMSVNGEAARPPVRVGTSIVDKGTGMWSVIGVLSMLEQRRRTGRGGIIDTSLLETALAWMGFLVADYAVTGKNPTPQGSGVRGIAPYQAYACADGCFLVAAANDRLFSRLADVMGHPEWPKDERFSSNPSRYRNLVALNEALEPLFAADTREVWQTRLNNAGIPCAPLQQLDEVLVNPQVAALEILQQVTPDAMTLVGLPLSFNGGRPPARYGAPDLGEFDAEYQRGNYSRS
jgi:crotonobetainyl-CoA:carnitine CoA-transferase CaiB-like acyl-CoA transferase